MESVTGMPSASGFTSTSNHPSGSHGAPLAGLGSRSPPTWARAVGHAKSGAVSAERRNRNWGPLTCAVPLHVSTMYFGRTRSTAPEMGRRSCSTVGPSAQAARTSCVWPGEGCAAHAPAMPAATATLSLNGRGLRVGSSRHVGYALARRPLPACAYGRTAAPRR